MAIQLALAKERGQTRPTGYIALSGKSNLKQIVEAQRALFRFLPEFEGFRLKACDGCHSGLHRVVIGFDPAELNKFKNVITKQAAEVPKGPIPG